MGPCSQSHSIECQKNHCHVDTGTFYLVLIVLLCCEYPLSLLNGSCLRLCFQCLCLTNKLKLVNSFMSEVNGSLEDFNAMYRPRGVFAEFKNEIIAVTGSGDSTRVHRSSWVSDTPFFSLEPFGTYCSFALLLWFLQLEITTPDVMIPPPNFDGGRPPVAMEAPAPSLPTPALQPPQRFSSTTMDKAPLIDSEFLILLDSGLGLTNFVPDPM